MFLHNHVIMSRDITVNGITIPANTMIHPIMVEILKVIILYQQLFCSVHVTESSYWNITILLIQNLEVLSIKYYIHDKIFYYIHKHKSFNTEVCLLLSFYNHHTEWGWSSGRSLGGWEPFLAGAISWRGREREQRRPSDPLLNREAAVPRRDAGQGGTIPLLHR